MTKDLSTLLEVAAPTPRAPIDVEAVVARGRQLARRRLAAAATVIAVVVLAGGSVLVALVERPEAPVVGPAPSVTPSPGTRPAATESPTVVAAADIGSDTTVHGPVTVRLMAVIEYSDGRRIGCQDVLESSPPKCPTGQRIPIEFDGVELPPPVDDKFGVRSSSVPLDLTGTLTEGTLTVRSLQASDTG